MTNTRKREMKHILANFSLRKKATGYRMDTDSSTVETVLELFRDKLIRCTKVSWPFMFVIPTIHIQDIELKNIT